MKLLVDAQLPRILVRWLQSVGIDAVHTFDLPDGNRTEDGVITDLADREDRWVVTKDADFVQTHLLHGRPRRLLLISTGNCDNHTLIAFMSGHWDAIKAASVAKRFLELTHAALHIHE